MFLPSFVTALSYIFIAAWNFTFHSNLAFPSPPLLSLSLPPDYTVHHCSYLKNVLTFMSWQGCAFLHVSKEHQPMIKPLVISSGFGAGFNSQFIWTGKAFVHKLQTIIMIILLFYFKLGFH